MSRFILSKVGAWSKAGAVLSSLAVNIFPAFKASFTDAGDLVLDKILNHIDAQDLPWTPLSQRTIELKGGSTTIYVDSGYLRNNIEAVKVTESSSEFSIFVGALSSRYTPQGVNLDDLMMWLEFGTDKMPPRPIIRPTWEEVRPLLIKECFETLKNLCFGGK